MNYVNILILNDFYALASHMDRAETSVSKRVFVNYPAPILIGLRRLSIKCVIAR